MSDFFGTAPTPGVLTVGPDEPYHTISAAVAAAQDGDTIEVQAGTYINDFPTITHSLTIEGVGGIAYLEATTAPPNDKAIMLVGDDINPSPITVVVKDLGFEGAQISGDLGGNAAGIKLQSGNLTVEDSYFAGNQMGILTGNFTSTSITVQDSEFAGQTGEVNGLSHQLYVGNIGSATVDHNLFLANANGNQIKSRAETSIIENNTIDDGTGSTSYDIDLPNGGTATISGNTIVKGVNDPNTTVIAFGEEGQLWSQDALSVTNNIIDNHLIGHGIGVSNFTSAVADIANNQFYNLPTVAVGPNVQSGNTVLTTEPLVSDVSPITTIPAPTGTGDPTGSTVSTIESDISSHVQTALITWVSHYGSSDFSGFNQAVSDAVNLVENPGSPAPADTQTYAMQGLVTALTSDYSSWQAAQGSAATFTQFVDSQANSIEVSLYGTTSGGSTPPTSTPPPTTTPTGTGEPTGPTVSSIEGDISSHVQSALITWVSHYGSADFSAFNQAVSDAVNVVENPSSPVPADTQSYAIQGLVTALTSDYPSWLAAQGSTATFTQFVNSQASSIEVSLYGTTSGGSTPPTTTTPTGTGEPTGATVSTIEGDISSHVQSALITWVSHYGSADFSPFNQAVSDAVNVVENPSSPVPADTQTYAIQGLVTALTSDYPGWLAAQGSTATFTQFVDSQASSLEQSLYGHSAPSV